MCVCCCCVYQLKCNGISRGSTGGHKRDIPKHPKFFDLSVLPTVDSVCCCLFSFPVGSRPFFFLSVVVTSLSARLVIRGCRTEHFQSFEYTVIVLGAGKLPGIADKTALQRITAPHFCVAFNSGLLWQPQHSKVDCALNSPMAVTPQASSGLTPKFPLPLQK